MVVIALMGKANSGKTSSLKFLMQNLLKVKGIEAKYLSRGYSPDTQACIDSISKKWNTVTHRVSDVTLVAELDGKKYFGILCRHSEECGHPYPKNRARSACGNCGRHPDYISRAD